MVGQVLPITGLRVGSVSAAVLVCGDPARVDKTAEHLTNPTCLANQREYRAIAGDYEGMAVTVCSHGVGAPGAAVAFEELIAAGARRIIRIGSCGGIMPSVTDGDLVIATAAVSECGYVQAAAPRNFPAVASLDLTFALRQAAVVHGHPYHTGMIISRDVFYAGIGSPYAADYAAMAEAGVLAVEMECAALFVVGALRRVQTAAILAVDGNVLVVPESMGDYKPNREVVQAAVEAEIQIALAALCGFETAA